jgi:histidinol-phosphate/aromatic aminotransferase/cobyric acid decarboxylase-like protein/imidazoleglycerol phosphate dehydratase HisB
MTSAVGLPASFAPYTWAPPLAEIAARTGLSPAEIIRFDQNVPPLPGVPQVPVGASFARLNDYPDGTYGELREAAAAYSGVEPDQIVVGAGADDVILLVARTFLDPGRVARAPALTYPLYRIATGLAGAEIVEEGDADLVWVCNPSNPTGELAPPGSLPELGPLVVVDEAYWEYAGETVVPLGAPNVIAIRTLSKAFGLAALRVGYAVCPPELARVLEARRAPAPIAAPAARIAAAALREPRLDIEQVVAERERMRAALRAAGYEVPESRGSYVYVAADRADELEAQGLVVRGFPGAFRATVRLPAENDRLLAALGVGVQPSPRRTALLVRTTTETALRISLDLDGRGRARVATGIGLLDHFLTALAFHGGLDLELLAGGDLEVDEHHTTEDVLAALGDALAQALGTREGLTRYGSADVPMDEALARCTVDLVQRPHAEVRIEANGTVLPHALERFAMQARLTLHVEAAGTDSHHVAEAAFKALGRALRVAVAPGSSGSTKGAM